MPFHVWQSVSVASWTRPTCVAQVYILHIVHIYITSWSHPFLLVIGEEGTNTAVPCRAQTWSKEVLYFCCISIDRTSIQSLQLEMSAHFQATSHHHLESPLRLCSFLAWALCFVLYTNRNYGSTNLLYLGFFFGASEQLKTACLPSSVSHRQASV